MSQTPPDGDAQSPWTQRGFVVSAAVVALILVLGVGLAIIGPSKDDPAPGPQAAVPSASPAQSSGDAGSSCNLPAGDQTVPRTPPANTKWELVGTMAVPTAPETHGPGRVDGGLRTCYAHTPTGALYAAVNFTAAASDPRLRVAAAQKLTAAGAGRARAEQEARDTQSDSSGGVQLVGFTFLNYDAAAATVDLAMRATKADGQTTGLVHIPLSLRWEDGDWKVVLPASGEVYPGLGPIPNLTGYVPLSGA